MKKLSAFICILALTGAMAASIEQELRGKECDSHDDCKSHCCMDMYCMGYLICHNKNAT